MRIHAYPGAYPWQVVGETEHRRALVLTRAVFRVLPRPATGRLGGIGSGLPRGLRAWIEGDDDNGIPEGAPPPPEAQKINLVKRGAVWWFALEGRTVRRAERVWCAPDGTAWAVPSECS